MFKNYRLSAAVLFALVLALIWQCAALAAESKFSATGTNEVSVTFGPLPAGFGVKGVYVTSDKSGSLFKYYTKAGGGRKAVTTASTSGAQVVYFDNADHVISTNDYVVYVHSDGTLLTTTVTGSGTGQCTLATGLTEAGSTADYIYEVQESYRMPVGAGTLNPAGSYIFAVPPDSPLWTVVDCSTAATVAVTADR